MQATATLMCCQSNQKIHMNTTFKSKQQLKQSEKILAFLLANHETTSFECKYFADGKKFNYSHFSAEI